MWWRRLAEVRTEHQNGEEREFKLLWMWNGWWCNGWCQRSEENGQTVRDDRKATVTQITTRYNRGIQNTISERTTQAQVPWWVKFLRVCSRQCKMFFFLHMDSTYLQTIQKTCAKYTYIYSVHIVYYKDILCYQLHIIHRMYTIYTLCSLYIVIMWRCNRL